MFPYETINWSRHPPNYHKISFGQGNDNTDVVFDSISTTERLSEDIDANNVKLWQS